MATKAKAVLNPEKAAKLEALMKKGSEEKKEEAFTGEVDEEEFDDDGPDLFTNRFAEKQEEIDGEKIDLSMEGTTVAAVEFVTTAIATSKKVVKEVTNVLTPGFIKRYYNKKIYTKAIGDIEASVEKIKNKAEKVQKKELKNYQKEKKKNDALKKKLEKKQAATNLTKSILKEAKDDLDAKAYENFKERRKALAKEADDKVLEEIQKIEAKKEDEASKRRQWRMKHWTQFAKTAALEAKQLKAARINKEIDEYNESLQRIDDEWKERDLGRARLQVEGPALSDPVGLPGHELGIFSVPMGAGAFHSRVDHGEKEGVDIQELHLFSPTSNIRYESTQIDYSNNEAELARTQLLYDSIQNNNKMLIDSIERIKKLKEIAEIDLQQVTTELQQIEKLQLGPPKRLPMAQEIASSHMRKMRINQLKKTINDFNYTVDMSRNKIQAGEQQMLSVAKTIAQLKGQQSGLQNSLTDMTGQFNSLPVVIGVGIQKVKGNDETARPESYYQAIYHQSRLAVYRGISQDALKAHKERVEMDQVLWVQRQSGNETKIQSEAVLNRLADIRQRMKDHTIDSLKRNLIDALDGLQQALLHKKVFLNPALTKMTGMLTWWGCRDEAMCDNVEMYMSDSTLGGITFEPEDLTREPDMTYAHGITLTESNAGYCQGVIQLPKEALWTLLIPICKTFFDPMSEEVLGDENDYISIKLGATFGTLQHIATVYNKINPDTGCVLYDIKHIMRGERIAFRFDFSSSSTERKVHLAVSTGLFEEYEMKALEFFPDPKGLGRERVLSSYVKMIRINELQGKLRLPKLIEELLNVENSTTSYWDSEIVNGSVQRYSKDYFLRIIRAEILLENKTDETNGNKTNDDERVTKFKALRAKTAFDKGEEAERRLEISRQRYTLRKRTVQQHLVDEAMMRIGRKLEIYDDISKKYKHCLVKDCIVRWVENGIKAFITHIICEYNKFTDTEGKEMEVDLTQCKYFDSPTQTVDKDTILRYLQQKQWEGELNALNREADKKTAAIREEYNTFCDTEERKLLNEKVKIPQKMEDTEEEELTEAMKKSTGKKLIKTFSGNVLLDMKRGIIKYDVNMKPEELKAWTYELAKERFITFWKKQRQEEIKNYLDNKEKEVKAKMRQFLLDVQAREEEIMKAFRFKKFYLDQAIREQKKEIKQALLKKVAFDPKIFSLAVPKGQTCDHTYAKSWGDKYGKGLRCKTCGKEISEMYKEESQKLGYGSGCSRWMYEAVKRHRINEQAFRFKDPAEITTVEMERRRLEKERRELEEAEVYFYDFQDLHVIYEFDRRHASYIKRDGVFRQGLHWKEEELQDYEKMKLKQEESRIKEAGLIETVINKFDTLAAIEEPPPTFRAQDERRKAQYGELMFGMGRLHTYQRRITDLKGVRLELMSERSMISEVLVALHRDSFHFDSRLLGMEEDLQRTGRLLAIYDRMTALWMQASRILRQAERERRKAEMKQCGVWDDVKELQDVSSFLHDETRSLLKAKFIIESKSEKLLQVLAFKKSKYEEAVQNHIEIEKNASNMRYCKPGEAVVTRYGHGWIRAYRIEDNMLMVELPFGIPAAKAWINADEVINAENSKQQGERLLMDIEDNNMHKYLSSERSKITRERFLMSEEEKGMKRLWQFMDLGKIESVSVLKAVNEAIKEGYAITKTPKFLDIQKKTVKERAKKWGVDTLKLHKTYKGPPSGRPQKPTQWSIYQKRKEIALELDQAFITSFADKAEQTELGNSIKRRTAWIENYTIDKLTDQTIQELIDEIASEAVNEGKNAKASMEKLSGLIFPNPQWMQFGVYYSLAEIWKRRKAALKLRIEINRGLASKVSAAKEKPEITAELLKEMKEKKRLIKRELRRQERLNAEMEYEDNLARTFYQWELKENLRERREMREEDKAMQAIRKEEKKRAKEAAAKAKYGGNLAKNSKESSNAPASQSYDQRRDELKQLTLERRRRAEEEAYMTIEDKLSEALREIDRAERAKKEYEKEFGKDPDMEGDEEFKIEDEVVIPSWMAVPVRWDDWSMKQQKEYIMFAADMRKREKEVEKKIRRQEIMLDKLEDKSFILWAENYSVVEQKELESELAIINAEDDVKTAEFELSELRENIRRITIFCREKGEEELKAKTKVRKQQELARRRDRDLEDARKWENLCLKRAKNREKLKRKVTVSCRFVDTSSITGFHQRFRTELLRARLFEDYFREIAMGIINRAETVATERRIMALQNHLSSNKALLMSKMGGMKKQWHEIMRSDMMRIRRSELNKKFFPRHRKEVLQAKFGSWLRFFLWNRGHREAFEMKYEIIKRQLDIDRQFKAQLHGGSTNADEEKKKNDRALQGLMAKYKDRCVQCKSCLLFYIESNNNSISCTYHRGQFIVACPSTCQSPGLTAQCAAHRLRRWTCCDNTQRDVAGCGKKYHQPPDSDPIYDQVMEAIRERDRITGEDVDQRLIVARKENWPLQLRVLKTAQIHSIEDTLQKGRDAQTTYYDLGLDKFSSLNDGDLVRSRFETKDTQE